MDDVNETELRLGDSVVTVKTPIKGHFVLVKGVVVEFNARTMRIKTEDNTFLRYPSQVVKVVS